MGAAITPLTTIAFLADELKRVRNVITSSKKFSADGN